MKYSPSKNLCFDPSIHGEAIPGDAVDITDDLFRTVVLNRPPNKQMVPGLDGYPTLIDTPSLTENQQRIRQIIDLERTVTPRRLREAALGIDNGWLADINAQIEALRAALTDDQL